MDVSAAYAKSNLAQLLKAVENGETITIHRYKKRVAQLGPPKKDPSKRPMFGTGKGRVEILDPNWDRAIETESELLAFLSGKRE